MGFLMMAPAMEDREGTFTVYGVGSKVNLVYTPQERMILDHIMFQHGCHQLASSCKHMSRQHGLVLLKAVCIVRRLVCSIVFVLARVRIQVFPRAL